MNRHQLQTANQHRASPHHQGLFQAYRAFLVQWVLLGKAQGSRKVHLWMLLQPAAMLEGHQDHHLDYLLDPEGRQVHLQ
jgi:hypothetical protein